MRKHTKPHRVLVSAPVVPQSTAIVERVRRIITGNNSLLQEEWFILNQVHLRCLFRLAGTRSRQDKNGRYITKQEDDYLTQNKGKENSLTSQDFLSLNQWIANQDSADKRHTKLEALIKRVKERKREAKRVKKIKDHHLPPPAAFV